MSVRIHRPQFGPNKGKALIVSRVEVHVDEYVDVDIDIELDQFVKDLKPQDRAELLKVLTAGGPTQPAVDGGVHPEVAYYALAKGDMDTVRRFICECAGRIA